MIHTGEKPHMCTFPGCGKKFSEKGNMKTHFKTHVKTSKKTNFVYSDILDKLELSIKSSTSEVMTVVAENKPAVVPANDNKAIVHCEQYTYIGSKNKRMNEKTAPKRKTTKTNEFTADKEASTRCEVTENIKSSSPTHDNNPTPILVFHPETSYNISTGGRVGANISHPSNNPMSIFIPEEVYDFPQIFEKNPMEKLYEDNYLFLNRPVVRKDSNALIRYDTLYEN